MDQTTCTYSVLPVSRVALQDYCEAVYTTTPHTNRRFRNLDPAHDAQHPSMYIDIFFQSSAGDLACAVSNGLFDTLPTLDTAAIVYCSRLRSMPSSITFQKTLFSKANMYMSASGNSSTSSNINRGVLAAAATPGIPP